MFPDCWEVEAVVVMMMMVVVVVVVMMVMMMVIVVVVVVVVVVVMVTDRYSERIGRGREGGTGGGCVYIPGRNVASCECVG